MFTHYRTTGFIFKKTDLGESDQLLTIYTKGFGKLEILGRAIRKISSKLRPSAELFYLSEIEFIQGKTYKTLTDAILVEKFAGIRKNLRKQKLAYKIAELLDILIKGQEPDKKIWCLLNETFKELDNCSLLSVYCFLIYYYFFWQIVSILGYKPELYHCARCQKKLKAEELYFSQKEGGMVCNLCKKLIKSTIRIDIDTVKILRFLLAKDLATIQRLKISAKNLNSLKTISDHFLAGMALLSPH